MKHIHNKHGWYSYCDKKPDEGLKNHVKLSRAKPPPKQKANSNRMPSFSKENPIAIEFSSWLRSAVGRGRVESVADQIVSRAFKYLRYCCDETEDDELDESKIAFCIGSTDHFIQFIELVEKDYDIGPLVRVGYLNAVLELIDFRKCKGASYSTGCPKKKYTDFDDPNDKNIA